MTALRILFMGTPDFAVLPLRALHAAGHSIVAVYAQPPRPAGRGQTVQLSPVHKAAEALGLAVRTPKSLKSAEEQAALAALAPDIAVVAAYGLILPQAVLDAPRLGCVNIHASLLPRWRGAAPIQRAILAGDAETGITIMQMEAGLDTGPMLMTERVPITPATTAGTLHDALAEVGARLIPHAVAGLAEGRIQAVPQPDEGVTYAAKLTREDALVDWTRPASFIERQVRALTPWPGTQCVAGGETIKILKASLVEGRASLPPGTLLDDSFTVACGEQAVRCDQVQRAGKKPTDGAALLRGLRLPIGQPLA